MSNDTSRKDSNDGDDTPMDTYRCGDCGYTETVPYDEKAGAEETRTFGTGRRERKRTVLVCPECKSNAWLSDSVRDLAGTVEKGVSDLE